MARFSREKLLSRWIGELKDHELQIILGVLGVTVLAWLARLGISRYRAAGDRR